MSAERAIGPDGTIARVALGPVLIALAVKLDARTPCATRPATLVWLGASMVLAARRRYAGRETLALSNWLRRDDQIGCVVFWPVDEVEARLAARSDACQSSVRGMMTPGGQAQGPGSPMLCPLCVVRNS